MNTTCKKCGTVASQDQAFCAKCGAVIGMEGPRKPPKTPDLARTIAVKDFKLPQLPKKQDRERTRDADKRVSPPSKSDSNSILLAVAGFLAVLVIGGLFFLVLYFFL